MQISELMTPSPDALTPDDTVLDAAHLIERSAVGMVPILESRDTRRLIGCITERDIAVRVVSGGVDPEGSRSIALVMSEQVLACHPEDDVGQVATLMRERELYLIPVVDEHRSLVGVVSLAKLTQAALPVGSKKDEGPATEPDPVPK